MSQNITVCASVVDFRDSMFMNTLKHGLLKITVGYGRRPDSMPFFELDNGSEVRKFIDRVNAIASGSGQ
ncbi:hypothetical protein BELL_1257g00040 [Botrytis elliptica]|uniref:Uncharacterized protein n=1 Tax=Botrytis elliptica TaxID=278938 RepID=A0A4Z1IC13_9HELO|nr:hypothetical protein BELL_1257g00040 [Botrytis elliptica]